MTYKILVVDDEPMNLKMAEVILNKKNYKILTAVSALDAMNVLGSDEIDLLLLDVMMPVMDGFELLKKIRESEKNKDLPVIMLTADGGLDSVKRALGLKVEGYIRKPFLPKDLLEAVNRHFVELEQAKNN